MFGAGISAVVLALTAIASAQAAEVSCERYDPTVPHTNPFDQFDQNGDTLPSFDELPDDSQGAIPLAAPNFGQTTKGEQPASTTSGAGEWTDVKCIEGLLRGAIVKGDYEKIVSLFRTSHPLLYRFYLISPGGSVEEALRIGRLFRKYMITAQAPFERDGRSVLWPLPDEKDPRRTHPEQPLCDGDSDCICASACALIWFGSPDRLGTVGLHRPHTDDRTFRELSPAGASAAYRRMLDNVRRYLDEMEVPKQVIETMVATGSAETRWVDSSKNELRRPPSIAEWEDTSCGPFTNQENETLEQMVARANRSQQETLLFNQLLEKFEKKERCVADLISVQRGRLASP